MVGFIDNIDCVNRGYGQTSQDRGSEMMGKINFYFGTAAGSILLAVMVIVGELYIPFKDLLKNIFSHHWVGKLVVISAVFFAVSFFYSPLFCLGSRMVKKKLIAIGVLALFAGIVAYFFISSESSSDSIPAYVTWEKRMIYEWAKTSEGATLLEQMPCYCGCKYENHLHTPHCFLIHY